MTKRQVMLIYYSLGRQSDDGQNIPLIVGRT